MNSDATVSPWMEQLSGYIAGAIKRKLPARVAERAKIHVVDTFAAMISGSRLLPGKRALAYAKTMLGTREAGVIGTRLVTSAPYAALTNGMFGHADETDDTHPPSRAHPGTSIIPAALAIAEQQRLSGDMILRATVLGYDICTRMLLALRPEQLRKVGHQPIPIGGVFGAAAAAGALLKLDAAKMRHVISYCAQQAAGIYTTHRDSQHVEKAYALGGRPARNGLEAALMVKSGFTGVEDVLSGQPNFPAIFSPDAELDALVRGLGHEYEIMRCSIKRWPAAGSIQAPLDVLHHLMVQHAFDAADIDQLVVRVSAEDLKTVTNRDMPDITLSHLLAVTLLDGALTHATAHDVARMKDPRVLELRRDHIETVGDPDLVQSLRPWACAIEIQLKDGRKLAHETTAAKGSSDNPLTRRDEEAKALDLIAPVLGKQRSRTLISTLFEIETVKDARMLRKLYAA